MSELVRALKKSVIVVGASNADYPNTTTGLQAAIDLVTTSTGIKTVLLTSDVSLSATITLKSNTILDLGGRTVTLANSANVGAFNTPSGGSSNITLRNGIVDGNRTNQSAGTALVDIGGNGGDLINVVVEDLYVKNSYQHAIYVHGAGFFKKIVRNCMVQNHGSASVVGFGIYFDFAPNSVMDGCTVYDSNGNDSVELGNSGSIICVNNYIEDGDIQFPFSHNAIIANNILRLGKILNDTNTANGVTIVNNQLLSASPVTSGYSAIRVDGANSRIIGNYIKTDQKDGIKVQNGDNHIIESNYVETDAITSGETGILAATNANNVQIKNNIIKNFDLATRITYDNVEVTGNKAIDCTTGVSLTASAVSGHTILNAMILNNDFADVSNGLVTNSQASYLGIVFGNIGITNSDISVPDEAYGSGWNGSLEVPTKNAVYDKIETLPTATIASGVYTPTRSAEANMDANVTMTEAQYMRVGTTVTVSGRFTADPTLTATTTSFEITLPVASNIGAAEDVAGVAFCGNIAAQGAEIIGVAANDTAKIQWKASDVTSQVWSYIFTYQII